VCLLAVIAGCCADKQADVTEKKSSGGVLADAWMFGIELHHKNLDEQQRCVLKDVSLGAKMGDTDGAFGNSVALFDDMFVVGDYYYAMRKNLSQSLRLYV